MEKLLNGIKVLDFTNNIAGPSTTALMADHGAEVFHIEKPIWGDDCRNFPPLFDGVSSTHMKVNRGKKSVVLNLKDPIAVDVIRKMIPDMDVVVESARPGVMKKLGLSYDDLKELNSRLVYCSISAYGQDGPYAEKAGYDVIAQAFSGFMYYTGEPTGNPTKITSAIGDLSTAINAFGQIMLALFYRERSGKGQFVDVSLCRTLVWMNGGFEYLYTGKHRQRTGNHDAQLCPYGIFKRSDEEYIVIGAVNVSLWVKLCKAMGREDLAQDERFITNDKRVENSAAVIDIIEQWLESLPSVEVASRLLDSFGVPNCKLNTMEDIVNDPQVIDQNWLYDVPACIGVNSVKSILVPCLLAELSEAEPTIRASAALGEDSVNVLSHYGLSEEEISEYEKKWADTKLC